MLTKVLKGLKGDKGRRLKNTNSIQQSYIQIKKKRLAKYIENCGKYERLDNIDYTELAISQAEKTRLTDKATGACL